MTRYEARRALLGNTVEIPDDARGVTIDTDRGFAHYLVPVDGDAVRGGGGVGDPVSQVGVGKVEATIEAARDQPDLEALIDQCPDAEGRAGEHLSEARYHLREAAQLLEAQEVLER